MGLKMCYRDTRGYEEGYLNAIEDVKTLLRNSRENSGGIFWGSTFIEDAHWGFELEDQLTRLKDELK